jgi:hypothetical protein
MLDFFRRGEVARDIRLQAAQGGMAPRAHEQIALLMLLLDDHDPEIAAAAEGTISMIPRAALEAFLARSDASTDMREFFAGRGIEPGAIAAQAADAPLVESKPSDDALTAIIAEDEEPADDGVRAVDGPEDRVAERRRAHDARNEGVA